MKTKLFLTIPSIVVLMTCASCMTSDTIYLKKGATVVQCGPFMDSYLKSGELDKCVGDYQLAGYERTPKPSEGTLIQKDN